MVFGSTGRGFQLRSFSSFVPWNSPQSTSSFLPAASTRYLEPVTHPAAPRKVSFAIGEIFYRNSLFQLIFGGSDGIRIPPAIRKHAEQGSAGPTSPRSVEES